MKKTTRVLKAKETIQILEAGAYEVAGRNVAIRSDLDHSLARTELHFEDQFEPVFELATEWLQAQCVETDVRVQNCTVLEGATLLLGSGRHVGCLNFASAKNSGGGFLNGAVAQEESLALSSSLYATLQHKFALYEHNRRRDTYLYSDAMIYSPDVVFFRDDAGDLLPEPYRMSVVTSPAVNVGAMRTNRPEELALVEETMDRRMDKMLALFVRHRISHLLLGAWGCGVFQNDAGLAARLFARHLTGAGKYARCFEQVLFAVYDRSPDGRNIRPFAAQFGGED